MNRFKKVLENVISFVRNESDNVVDDLLMMGFPAEMLIYDFGFDEEEIRASEVCDMPEEFDWKTEYPFFLSNYDRFDAALINWFMISPKEHQLLKESNLYQKMREDYEEEMCEVEEEITEILNKLFSKNEETIQLGIEYNRKCNSNT